MVRWFVRWGRHALFPPTLLPRPGICAWYSYFLAYHEIKILGGTGAVAGELSNLLQSWSALDGRDEHTSNFELGFSVNAIVSMGRKAMERQGGKVSLKSIV